jgi:conjugative transfer region lipoprotein (TIGR03751 family)
MHYTRSEAKELKGIFPRLPNPDLCMYVYPHLSLEEATIPGYSSCFSLYDKNHYALPGEMPATLQANY